MALISISNCPICNGTKFDIYFSCNDFTASREAFTLKKCNTCHFTITDPRPDNESLNNYYLSEKYISHTGGGGSLIDRIYLLARKLTLGWKRKLVKEYSTENNILDIGCGTGEFLNEMKTHSWNIAGVEPSSKARETAEKITGVNIQRSLSEVIGKKFSVITLWHVLEHLSDPNQTLQTLHNLLNESGTIFIAVPNLNSYDAHFYKSFWAAYDVPRHLWHFDKKSMKILLEKNGFKLTKIVPMRLDSFYVSLLSETYEHPKRPKFFQLAVALMIGFKSNLRARKTLEFSSLIYIVNR